MSISAFRNKGLGRYKISAVKNGLLVRTVEPKSGQRAILSSLGVGVAAGALAQRALSHLAAGIIGASVAVLVVLLTYGKRTAELLITEAFFELRGFRHPNGELTHRVFSADILGFTYLTHSEEGTEFPDFPEGLYALVGTKYNCILPFVDREDVPKLVIEIQRRFPSLAWLQVARDILIDNIYGL